MSREWKPGDMAMIQAPNGHRHLAMMGPRGNWQCSESPGWTCIGEPYRVVVIDFEDREAVERLTNAYLKSDREGAYDAWWQDMQAALREFADPKPPIVEPQGLGAVVEAEDGRRWVRALPDGGPAKWLLVTFQPVDRTYVWSAIPAVRVLSEGIS